MTDVPQGIPPRTTPFELGFPGLEAAESHFADIAEEVEARQVDPIDPGGFLLLGQVGRIVRELRGDEAGAESLQTFGAFIFHAWHFQRARRPLYCLEIPAARYLVETNPVPADWDHSLPNPAGYLQLPRHLFWTQPDPEGPAEPLDGFFWTLTTGNALSILAVGGMRGGRAGFSVVPLPPVPLADAEAWLTRSARPEGTDFETTLPGGELDRLYSLETAGEVLKLMARTLGYVATVPRAVSDLEPPPEEDESTLLPFRRIRLHAD